MAIVVDTSVIFAAYDTDDNVHQDVIEVLENAQGPFVVTAGILAEIGYMLGKHLGETSVISFLESLDDDLFLLEQVIPTDLRRCRELVTQYQDIRLGLADATVIATAERLNIQIILTLDERHFRAVRPSGFDHFILYPADYKS